MDDSALEWGVIRSILGEPVKFPDRGSEILYWREDDRYRKYNQKTPGYAIGIRKRRTAEWWWRVGSITTSRYGAFSELLADLTDYLKENP